VLFGGDTAMPLHADAEALAQVSEAASRRQG